jgi:hypothetical protein
VLVELGGGCGWNLRAVLSDDWLRVGTQALLASGAGSSFGFLLGFFAMPLSERGFRFAFSFGLSASIGKDSFLARGLRLTGST